MSFWLSSLPSILLAALAVGGSITGTVRDRDDGAPVVAAMVSLTDLGWTTVTDSMGSYRFADVPSGSQSMTVRRAGYAPRSLQALVPSEGTLEIDFELRPSPINLTVIEVRAPVPIRGLEDGDSTAGGDRGLSIRAVRQHPLPSEPDVLLATAGGEVGSNPESPSGLNIQGGASDEVGYLLDGIPVLSPYHSSGSFSAWNPDALSRLDLYSSSPRPDAPDALSGVVSASTRAPGAQHRMQGGTSTTQARVTVDGPLGKTGAGYLMSLRSGFPGLLAHRRERTYLQGESADWLGKLESPLFGGRLRLLGFGNENETGTAGGAATPVRNQLAWDSRSLGGSWTRSLRGVPLEFRAWSAEQHAGATWPGADSAFDRLTTARYDLGLIAMARFSGNTNSSAGGVRAERIRTSYRLRADSGGGQPVEYRVSTPVWAAFVQQERALTTRTRLTLALVSSVALGRVYLGPSARLRWQPFRRLSLIASYARRHQFAQSLRNAESVVGNIFPVDLHVGAGRTGVPVPRSDLGVIGLQYRPTQGLHLGLQGYARSFRGLALVAPGNAGPFATNGFVRGAGSAAGLALEAGASGTWYGLTAAYGLQRMRLHYGDSSYVPGYGARHSIDAGVTILPGSGSAIRLGVTSLLGRRTTAVDGPFEWESCNLSDGGCEFAGSPRARSEALGSTPLPGYLRVDLGLRQQWPLTVAGRPGIVAVFGTFTNLLGRRNTLTVVVDPATGRREPIEMRPRSPLVVGIDWRF
jgi:hypothetical protein